MTVSDDAGWSPLMSACSAGLLSMVQVLVDHQLQQQKELLTTVVLAKNDSGSTALHYTCSKGHTAIAKLLLEVLSSCSSQLLSQALRVRDKSNASLLHRVAACSSVTASQELG